MKGLIMFMMDKKEGRILRLKSKKITDFLRMFLKSINN